jgi:hypothetical protein
MMIKYFAKVIILLHIAKLKKKKHNKSCIRKAPITMAT